MNAFSCFKSNNKADANFSLSEYLASTNSSITSLYYEKAIKLHKEIAKFLLKSTLPVAVLSYDMESTNGDFLINSFISVSKDLSLNHCVLRTTSKNSTKKQILSQIQEQVNDSGLFVYIECVEEWPGEILCFVFEYLSDCSGKIGFVVDVCTDPRCLSQVLDAEILQKLTVEQFFFPDFSSISTDVLWDLTRKCNFPVMSKALFKALDRSKSAAFFIKILKGSLLRFFYENPLREEIFLKSNGLNLFVNTKDQWIEMLESFHKLLETPPMNIEITIQALNKSLNRTAQNEECDTISEFTGRFKTKDFDSFEALETYIVNLCEKDIITEEELNRLRAEYLKIPASQSTGGREQANARSGKWKQVYIIPKLRAKILNHLKPLDDHIKKLQESDTYILGICEYVDSDILNVTLQQLNHTSVGFSSDMQILFRILKFKGKHIELNSAFDEFVQNCRVNEGIANLQSRFLNACNCLWMLGLVKQSKKKKKANCLFLEKNFFGRSTFYN